MLLIIGKGGEGKSRIGRILKRIFGHNMNPGSLQKLETDKFARADQEGKLLYLDDDMKTEALPSTNVIKAIVTAEDEMDLMADRKISLNDLSEKVGIANVNLSKIKTGKVSAIRFSTLNAICKALDCQPGDILEYQEDTEE